VSQHPHNFLQQQLLLLKQPLLFHQHLMHNIIPGVRHQGSCSSSSSSAVPAAGSAVASRRSCRSRRPLLLLLEALSCA
jgi:hypothetical protein